MNLPLAIAGRTTYLARPGTSGLTVDFMSGRNTQLKHDSFNMMTRGGFGDNQDLADLTAGSPMHEQARDEFLARREAECSVKEEL